MTAPPTRASRVWSTASPVTTATDAELAAATERTCMPTQAACPTWLSQTLVAMPTSLGPDPPRLPIMSQAIQATQIQSLTLMESTCTTMRWRGTITSILPTTQPQQLIPATKRTVTMVTMKWTGCHRTHMPHCDLLGTTGRCPAAMSRLARTSRRLWWQNT